MEINEQLLGNENSVNSCDIGITAVFLGEVTRKDAGASFVDARVSQVQPVPLSAGMSLRLVAVAAFGVVGRRMARAA